jgi:hypothetical protein
VPNKKRKLKVVKDRSVDGTLGSNNNPKMEVVGICHTCTYRHADLFTCKAFPEGIPVEVLVGRFLHVDPYDGDNGVQYKRKATQ